MRSCVFASGTVALGLPSHCPQLGSLSAMMLSLPQPFAIASRLYCHFSLSSPIRTTRLLRLQAQPQTLGCRHGANPRLCPGPGSSLEAVCSLWFAPVTIKTRSPTCSASSPPCHFPSISRLRFDFFFKMSCFVLAMPLGTWNTSPLTGDRTHTLSFVSSQSEPLDYQGSRKLWLFRFSPVLFQGQ